MESTTNKLLSPTQAAKRLGYKTRKSIYQLEEKGFIKSVTLPGHKYRKYSERDIDAAIEKLKQG